MLRAWFATDYDKVISGTTFVRVIGALNVIRLDGILSIRGIAIFVMVEKLVCRHLWPCLYGAIGYKGRKEGHHKSIPWYPKPHFPVRMKVTVQNTLILQNKS